MEIIYLLIGIFLGAITAWFIAQSKFSSASSVSKEEFENANMHITELQTEIAKLGESKIYLESAARRVESELESERLKSEHLTKQCAQAETENKNLFQRLDEERKEVENLNIKLTTEFQNIASAILDEKTKKFTDQNKEQLAEILLPLRERIKDFETKVEQTYDRELRDKTSLREEVHRLIELNSQLTEEANNLTKALKGDTKKQGNWGEFILEKVLEMSGLEKEREYTTQITTKNIEGETIRPDVVVNLPDNKHIIIDAKVSLVAYEAFANAETDAERAQYMKEHVNSMRSHIKLLSEKNYQTGELFSTPDFVLLFVPIEPSFSVALQADPTLYNFAWEKKIVIVSPSTLLATLRTIASFWKQEKQSRNALEIAKKSGDLYDKFVGLVEDFLKVGSSMNLAQQSYQEAMKKLSSGSGNLVKRVEDIKKLGAKATKSLPQNLLDRANES